MSGSFKLKYKNSAFPFKSPLKSGEIEGFSQTKSKDNKTSLSTIGSLGFKVEHGKKKASGFGALVLGRKIGEGEGSLNASKVIEYNPKNQSNIISFGGGYKNKKGFYVGGEISKGNFTEKDDFGTYKTKGKWEPSAKIQYKGFSLKANPKKAMFGFTKNF